jgi:ABC-2 type transport system ATP-binding protein
MTTDVVLRTRHLRKAFGAVRAVEDVSLAVERGEVFGFLGPNGAGKTTTIGMVLGLVHPSGGAVELFGEPVTPARNGALRRVGAMVGEPAVVPGFSARENLRCLARLHPELPPGRVDEALGEAGLAADARRRAGTFSTGMKRRLGLAMALLHRPELLILDEPGNGLDPQGVHGLREQLRSLAGEGVTVFLSSHLLHEVELICDRVAVIHRGRVIAEGTVAELRRGSPERVLVATADREATARILRTLPEARDVEVGADRVTVSGVSSEVVLHTLVSCGTTPREVTVERQDLESMFLELTREAI